MACEMHHILNYKLIIDYHDDLICAAICYATVRELFSLFHQILEWFTDIQFTLTC